MRFFVWVARRGYDGLVIDSGPLPNPPTRRQLQALLRSAGLRPQRRYGQHFLIDANLMRKLVDAAQLTAHDFVLEVGAGTGGLTRLLAAHAGAVLAVEVDWRLAAIARAQIGGQRVTVLELDVLEGKTRLAPALLERLPAEPGPGRLMLVANLPYQVASPLLINLLLDVPGMARLCFTVQSEVGQRLAATPGTKDYGQLSVLVQATGTLQRIARVPASAFWPRPKVDSVMLRLDTHQRVDRRGLWQTVKTGFAHRRKMLKANLGEWVGQELLQQVCQELGLDWRVRPEALSVRQWVHLSDRLRAGGLPAPASANRPAGPRPA